MTGKKSRCDLARLTAARLALQACMVATDRHCGIETLAVRADCIAGIVSSMVAIIALERIAAGIDPRPTGYGEGWVGLAINAADRVVERTYRQLEALPPVAQAAGRVRGSIAQATDE